jgi:hypothetical protein
MDGLKAELEKLHEMIKKMEKGELEVTELLYLEDAARAIYEKSVILKYKAFEKRSSIPQNKAEVPFVDQPSVSNAIEEEEEDGFDFGIFDSNEPEPKSEVQNIPPVAEEIAVPAVESEPEVQEHYSVTSTEEAKEDLVVKEVRVEHSVTEVSEKVSPADNSLAGRFSGSKLNSLIGAFGLNQRLQFINELFDGSSEVFSEAIKSLDTQADLAAARVKLAEYATQFEWDPKEETVLEFVSFVNRRYA